jgi:hypothetical protein
MFNLHRSAPRYPTIRQALARAGLSSATNPAVLGVVERRGSYSGRRVNFFRTFDPSHAEAQKVQVRDFDALDAHQDLVLASGHVEREGMVVINRRAEAADSPPPIRQPADRAAHADDEHLVFWDAEFARASGAALSEPAAAWRQAKAASTQDVGGP